MFLLVNRKDETLGLDDSAPMFKAHFQHADNRRCNRLPD